MKLDLNPEESMPAQKESASSQKEETAESDPKIDSDRQSNDDDKENAATDVENDAGNECEPKNGEPAEDELCTIWVGQLHKNVTEEILYELFLQAGPIMNARIPNDKEGKKRSFGFVEYVYDVSVPYAMALFEGTKLFGREIRMNSRNPERINVEKLRREMGLALQQNQRQKIAATFPNSPPQKDHPRHQPESSISRPLLPTPVMKSPLLPLPVLDNGQRPKPLLDNASWQSPQLGRGLLGHYPGQILRNPMEPGVHNVDAWPPLMFQPRPRETTAPLMMRAKCPVNSPVSPNDWNALRPSCPTRPTLLQRNVHFNDDPRRYAHNVPTKGENCEKIKDFLRGDPGKSDKNAVKVEIGEVKPVCDGVGNIDVDDVKKEISDKDSSQPRDDTNKPVPVNESLQGRLKEVDKKEVGEKTRESMDTCKEKAYLLWADKVLESREKTTDGGFVFRKVADETPTNVVDDIAKPLETCSNPSKPVDGPLELLNSSLQSSLCNGNKLIDPIRAFVKMAENNKMNQEKSNNSTVSDIKSSIDIEKRVDNSESVNTDDTVSKSSSKKVDGSEQINPDSDKVSSSPVITVSETIKSDHVGTSKSYSQALHSSDDNANAIKSYSQVLSKTTEQCSPPQDLQKHKHILGAMNNGKVQIPGILRPRESISIAHFTKEGNDNFVQKANNVIRESKFFKDKINHSSREVIYTPSSGNKGDNRWQNREVGSILKKESDVSRINSSSSLRCSDINGNKKICNSADPCGIIDEIMRQGKPVEIIQESGGHGFLKQCGKNTLINGKINSKIEPQVSPKVYNARMPSGSVPNLNSKTSPETRRDTVNKPFKANGNDTCQSQQQGNNVKFFCNNAELPGAVRDSLLRAARGRGRGQSRSSHPPVQGPCRRPTAPPPTPGCRR